MVAIKLSFISPRILMATRMLLCCKALAVLSLFCFRYPERIRLTTCVRGHDYAIPSVTYLVFDNTPGREHVRIALTKREEDPAKFLQPQSAAQLSMATISPNPAIDPTGGREQIQVSFKEDIPKPVPRPVATAPPVVHEAPVAPPTNDTPITNAIPDDDNSKDLFREDSGSGDRRILPITRAITEPPTPIARRTTIPVRLQTAINLYATTTASINRGSKHKCKRGFICGYFPRV